MKKIKLAFCVTYDFYVYWSRYLNKWCVSSPSEDVHLKYPVLCSVLWLSQSRVWIWLIFSQGRHIFNGMSQVGWGLFPEPLLHGVALPLPSVSCMWGFKDGDVLTGTVSPPLTICHRCWKQHWYYSIFRWKVELAGMSLPLNCWSHWIPLSTAGPNLVFWMLLSACLEEIFWPHLKMNAEWKKIKVLLSS